MEGDGVTEPDFLDDPEKLFREGAFVIAGRWRCIGDGYYVRTISRAELGEFKRAGELPEIGGLQAHEWWRPKALPRFNGPAINDLVVHRWHGPLLTAEQEVDIVRRVQAREGMAYDKLLPGFHRQILKVANGHMPRYWRPRRQSLRDKHTHTLFYEDLVAAGVAGMWKAALKFDVGAGWRFWTAARLPVIGAISDEARLWRRSGSGEGRLDRWLYTHPQASPEQVLRAQQRLVKRPVFRSLQEAAEGIKQFWAWGSNPEFDYDTAEADEAVEPGGNTVFVGMYSCFSRYTLSPQLKYHEPLSLLVDRFSGGLDTGPDVGNASKQEKPKEALDCTETAFVQFKNGKRQVTRQKAASYCYGIVATPELRARALEDLKFAEDRWQSRIRRGPLPAEQYPRWSTKFLNKGRDGQGTLGRADDENKQIVPAYVPVTQFKWNVEYRGTEGNVLQVLESPSRHCLKQPRPCGICSGSRTNNVPRLSISLSAA